MADDSLSDAAYEAGRAAHARGAVRTPALDPAVSTLLAARGAVLNRMGVHGAPRARAVAALLGFWLAGFDAALHSEPVKA